MTKTLLSIVAIAGALTLGSQAMAQAFPNRPVRIITAFSAASGPDVMLRHVAEGLSKKWKVPVVVDNRPGGSGFIAISEAKQASPDGYTLLHIEGVNVTAVPHMYAKVPYDAKKDLVPITPLHGNYFFVAVPATSPWTRMDQLIAEARKAPGKVSYGSWQVGSIAHIGGEMLADRSNASMLHVVFKQNTMLYQSLARGDVDWAYASIASAGALEKAGKIRFLALAGPSREAARPDVPTVTESGGPEGLEASSWVGVFARSGTPASVVTQINADLQAVLASAPIVHAMQEVGYSAMYMTPNATTAMIDKQDRDLGAIIKKINLKLD